MTEYVTAGYRIIEDNGTPLAVDKIDFRFVQVGESDTISYEIVDVNSVGEPVVEWAAGWVGFFDGVNFAVQDLESDLQVFDLTWSFVVDGVEEQFQSIVFFEIFEDEENEGQVNDFVYLFVLDGDPLPDLASPAEFETFVGGIESLSFPDEMSDFGPGAEIPFTGLAGVIGDEGVEITENFAVAGTGGSDSLIGGTGDNLIELFGGIDIGTGAGGNDTILGGGGNDLLLGGDGRDSLKGDNGNDTLFGDNGRDVLRGGKKADELFGGDGNDNLGGGKGNDLLRGEDGNDVLRGDGGNDDLDGNAGKDRLFGGSGDDILVGAAGDDRLFGNGDNDSLSGNQGSDLLEGAAGRDSLGGARGNDTLDGGTWQDTLTGGAGADTFILRSGYAADTITDFTSGEDALLLDQSLWTGTLTEQQVVDQFAELRDGRIVLDFGQDELVLEGVTDSTGLADDISFL